MTVKRKETTKTGTYFIMHLSVAVLVAFAITGSWAAALTIGIIEPIFQTFAYHFHEKFWKRVPVISG